MFNELPGQFSVDLSRADHRAALHAFLDVLDSYDDDTVVEYPGVLGEFGPCSDPTCCSPTADDIPI